jgi:peptide/nickel transport system permease protein
MAATIRRGRRSAIAVIAFLVRRLVGTVALLIVVSMITFGIFFLIPQWAGQTPYQLAAQYVGREPTHSAIIQVEERLGFNKPLVEQYGDYVKGIVAGEDYDAGPSVIHCSAPCFGYSFRNEQPVLPQITSRLPVTFSLAGGAAVLWVVFGVAAGVLSALRRRSIADRAVMIGALAGVSVPLFFIGPLLLLLFNYEWPIFPEVQYNSFLANPLTWAGGLVLPWIALAFQFAALYARLTRSGMLVTMGEDFIRTARAKGLRERRVVVRHGLRSALTPILTIFGMDLGTLLGGAVVTETVFSLPGIGQFAIQAIENNDLPEAMGVTLFAAFFIVIANMVVDMLYAVVDPRVRLS